ncbi:MAG: GTP-binding protein HflX [Planctomycetota bacterium]|jgi:GTP-binding protein HflX
MQAQNAKTKINIEKAVLVGLITQDQSEEQLFENLKELKFLAETGGIYSEETFYQRLRSPDRKTYVGKGKLEEIKIFIDSYNIDMVIFDDEISPAQLRNIEKVLECKVLDRAMLILNIFAQRAQTVQAKTQVELANLQYMLPRLKGLWTHLDRVKGGVGMKGAGETEAETDRRVARDNISKLKRKLAKIDTQNKVRRKTRDGMIRVSLVGYTNVGKSTIMKLLSKSDVFAENKLFATLDTTVRKVVINHVPFLLSDTVGFIRKLPHHLIESFKSTLDEVLESDILLHVVDISHPKFEDQINVVTNTLKELGAEDKPTFMVFNKMDLYRKNTFDDKLKEEIKDELLGELKKTWMAKSDDNAIFISAFKKENLKEFRKLIFEQVKILYLERYPYKASYIDSMDYEDFSEDGED